MTDELRAKVDALVAGRYPSFHEPLRQARRWNRGTAEERDAAALLLAELEKRYPTALVVRYEGAFNLANRKQRERTLERLKQIEKEFDGRLNEDTYSLWGRCHKEAGHECLDAAQKPDAPPDARATALQDADRAYEHALEQYGKAVAVAASAFPAVNVAFLTFMRAALARATGRSTRADELLEGSQRLAKALLAENRPKVLPDDDVWQPAARGEAHALLGDWDAALDHYRRAADGPSALPHHRKSMGAQLARLLQAYGLLGLPTAQPIADLALSLSPPDGAA